MRRILFPLLLVILANVSISQESIKVTKGERPPINLDEVPTDAYEVGLVQIKFARSMEKSIFENIIRADKSGFVETGIKAVDELNKEFGAKQFTPMLNGMYENSKNASQFKDRHRAWGFHLWFTVEVSSKANVKEMVKKYSALKEVEYAEPVYKKRLIGNVDPIQFLGDQTDKSPAESKWTPNDAQFANQWHYNNTGQNSGTAGKDIRLLQAWDYEKGHNGVIVAIVDGGIQTNHPDLTANMWANKGYNFVSNSSTLVAHDHGTHVAGTVAAVTNNSTGVSGIAGGSGSGDGVRLMSCQVFTSSSSGGFGQAPIYAADNGASISQNSWGYTSENVYEQSTLDAIDYFNTNGGGNALNGGITIFAAGNDNATGNWYPGCYSGALSVAATNNKDVRSYYSNYGEWVDISAPGGEQSSSTDARGVLSTKTGSGYTYMQGTSMACPHVSGVAALLISNAHRNGLVLTRTQLWNLLVNNVDNHYSVNSSYSGKLGSGRLNAYKALTALQSMFNNPTTPSTPTGLASSNVTTSGASLSWTASSGATSYDVQFRPQGGSWSLQTVTSNSVNLSSLASATTYEWQVRAKNSAGSSAYSSTASFTTQQVNTNPPSTPTGLASSNVTATTATVSWAASSGATSYDLQVRPQGGTWSTHNVTASSANLTSLTAATTYEWQVRATNANGSSSFSAVASFTTQPVTVTYCASKGNNFSYEWIAKVEVGTFANTSTAAGYTDFTSKNITMEVGKAYTIKLTPGFASSAYNEAWRVWVDLNGNGTFDATDLLFAPASMSNTVVTGTITIPAGTAPISTRLRVSMKYNATPTACEAFSYGEVEDYTVSIVPAQANPPATPTGLTAASITTSSAALSWSASSGATSYDVQLRPQGGTWSTSTVTTNSANASSLSAATTYEWQVRATNANGSSSYSASHTFTTLNNTVTYCASKGSNATYEWIQRVQLSEMNNTSGKNSGYANFTNLTATVARGETLPIYFQAGFASSSYTEYWTVWIDFNQNGVFEESEKLVAGSSSSSNLLQANITIPATANLGATRMRVTMKYNAAPTACETFSYGEVEDYTVNIVQTRTVNTVSEQIADELDKNAADAFAVYPNPVESMLTVNLIGLRGEVSLKIFDLQGRLVKTTMLKSIETQMDVSDLSQGVYIISVDEEKMPLNKRFIKQ